MIIKGPIHFNANPITDEDKKDSLKFRKEVLEGSEKSPLPFGGVDLRTTGDVPEGLEKYIQKTDKLVPDYIPAQEKAVEEKIFSKKELTAMTKKEQTELLIKLGRATIPNSEAERVKLILELQSGGG